MRSTCFVIERCDVDQGVLLSFLYCVKVARISATLISNNPNPGNIGPAKLRVRWCSGSFQYQGLSNLLVFAKLIKCYLGG